jgi:surface carbohydrate biosynthesis protein
VNIYIQLEIKARELEGRSLLALAAAERGHHVLLGDVERLLGVGDRAFPPGIFHDKSLTPTPYKEGLFRRITENGHALTSQDEEHFLALPSFDVPAATRFSSSTLALASRSFAWGPHERDALQERYPDAAHRIVATGSPRADLWRPDLAPFHARHRLPIADDGRPVILFSSNFSAVLDVNPFWIRIRDKRDRYAGPEDDFEFDRYDFSADKLRMLGEFVRAVRRTAAAHPDALVVVRPHPIEVRGAWSDLIGDIPGVLVTRAGTLTAWIKQAVVVVQNGCTSGYEARIGGTPVIAFHPSGIFEDHPVNDLARRAGDQEELAGLIADALEASSEADTSDRSSRAAWRTSEGEQVLARRLCALEGRLAADRIVDEWEEADVRVDADPFDRTKVIRARRRLRNRSAAIQRSVALRDGMRRARARLATQAGDPVSSDSSAGQFRIAHKFPPVSAEEMGDLLHSLRTTLDRFHDVSVEVLAPDLIAFRPSPTAKRPADPLSSV